MADEQTREAFKTALAAFDSMHLHKVMVAAYDRWCWDSGSDSDKDWYQVAEELLKERGVSLSTSQSTGDLTINADKLSIQPANGGIEQDLFEMSSGVLDISFDLRCALIRMIGDEIKFGSLTTNQGMNLRELIKEAAKEAIREVV